MATRSRADDPYLPEAVWSFTDTVGVFLAGLVAAVIALMILYAVTPEPTGITELVVSSTAQGGAQFALMAAFSAGRGSKRLDTDFGLALRLRDTWGLLAGIGLQFVVVYTVLLPLQLILDVDNPPQQEVTQVAGEARGALNVILVVLIVVVIAPVVEEMIFRGMLLSRLRRSMGRVPAVVISATVFAAVHLADPNAVFVVPGLVVIGLVLGYQALRTGTLSLPIFTHAGVNLIAVVSLLYGDQIIEKLEEIQSVFRL
jgi:membrane protease YdiL (CAAX protease family)